MKALTEGQNSTGGRNNNGRITSRFRGGGHKQAYRKIDFRRTKFDVPATVERIEYDPEPHRLHRAHQVPGRRACLHPGAPAPWRGDQVIVVRYMPTSSRAMRCRSANHSGRHYRTQYRDQDRQGRADRAFGRQLRPDRRARPGLRHPAAQFRRAAPSAWPLHGDHRRGVEPRQHEYDDRQGWPPALERPHAAQPRHHHEPGRSPAWRPHQGRQSLGHAVGLADQRRKDPQEQAHHQIHRRQPARPQEASRARD